MVFVLAVSVLLEGSNLGAGRCDGEGSTALSLSNHISYLTSLLQASQPHSIQQRSPAASAGLRT